MEMRIDKWLQSLDRLAPGLGRVLIGIRRRIEEEKAIRALQLQDDHVLADMGMLRGEIEAVVKAGRPGHTLPAARARISHRSQARLAGSGRFEGT